MTIGWCTEGHFWPMDVVNVSLCLSQLIKIAKCVLQLERVTFFVGAKAGCKVDPPSNCRLAGRPIIVPPRVWSMCAHDIIFCLQFAAILKVA